MKKMVNDKEVICSAEEEAEIRARWTKADAPDQADARKDAQVEAEFTPAMTALANALDPTNAALKAAKAQRKGELE